MSFFMKTLARAFGRQHLYIPNSTVGPAIMRSFQPEDGLFLPALFAALSEQSIWLRYGLPATCDRSALARREAQRLVAATAQGQTVLVIVAETGMLAIAEMLQDHPGGDQAEIALLVRDDVQRRGLGMLLGNTLAALASQRDITTLRAEIQSCNRGVMKMVQKLGVPHHMVTSGGESQLWMQVEPHNAALKRATKFLTRR